MMRLEQKQNDVCELTLEEETEKFRNNVRGYFALQLKKWGHTILK